MEVPLCYVAATLTKELAVFRGPDFDLQSPAESWFREEYLVGTTLEPLEDNPTLRTFQDILKPVIHNDFRRLADTIWDVAQCSSPDVVWGSGPTCPPETRWILYTLIDPPEAGLGHLAGGNLMAFSVMFARTLRRALLEHGEGLRPTALALAKKFGGKVAGLFAGTMGWPRMVDLAWDKLREANGGQEGQIISAWYQSRPTLRFEVPKAAALFLASCSPLTRAIVNGRNVQQTWSSLVRCVTNLADAMQTTADAAVTVLATKAGVKDAVIKFVDDDCRKSSWQRCPTEVGRMSDIVSDLAKMLEEPFQGVRQALKHLVMPVEYLVIIGAAFIGFCWLSSYLASVSLPKSVQFPRRSLLNMGIAGPLHLLAIVTEEHVKKVLDIQMQLIVLRGLILSVVMVATLAKVTPEIFTALVSNRIISRTQLLIAWLALWLGRLAKNQASQSRLI